MTARGSQPVLEVRAIEAGYGDILAIRAVSFTVAGGEVFALLGRNGAGKSTTLAAIAGVVRVRAGKIVVDGRDATGAPAFERARRGVALVPQGKRIFHRRTVHENLRLGGVALKRGERESAVGAAFERFPILWDRRAAAASTLSGGQQQMLAIAQALVSGPRVLLLDEPSAGLAPVVVDEVLAVVAELKRDGIGVIVVEQMVDRVLEVADTVAVLDRGRLVTQQPVGQVEVAALHDIYLGAPAGTGVGAPAPLRQGVGVQVDPIAAQAGGSPAR